MLNNQMVHLKKKKLKTVIFRVFIFDPVDSSFFRGFVDTSTSELKNHWVGEKAKMSAIFCMLPRCFFAN